MLATLLTHLQLFGIGFSFGIAGPCLLTCTPVLVSYVGGAQRSWGESLKCVFAFLVGRLLAYMVLGCLAGLSSGVLRQFISSNISLRLKPLGGVISIMLGIFILTQKSSSSSPSSRCRPGCDASRALSGRDIAGLLAFGFILGISPCAPLMALFLEIALIAKNSLDGAYYAMSFGMGTFLSGLVIVGALAGIIAWLPANILKSGRSILAFKIACAGLLILFGIFLIINAK